MNPAQFAKIAKTEDGKPIVTLMSSPSMYDETGMPVGFVSLVPAGANLRTFVATKGAEPTFSFDPTAGPPGALTVSSSGESWGRWFVGLFGKRGTATKDGMVVTFDAAIVAERLRQARWQSSDALWEVIGNILREEDVTDKVTAVGTALEQFKAHILGLVSAQQQLVSKGAGVDAVTLAELARPVTVGKAGRVISAANLAVLEEAAKALKAALTAVSALQELGSTTVSKSEEDLTMLNPEQIEVLANKASERAIVVAKGLGISDPARLVAIGTEAYAATVGKAAYSGPPQPSLAPVLDSQMDQSGGMGQKMTEPLMAMKAAIDKMQNSMSVVVGKVDKMEAAINGSGEGDAREPGIVEIATKALEVATATAEAVPAKTIASKGAKPAPKAVAKPNGSSEGDAAQRETVGKSSEDEEVSFKGSGLGSFTDRSARS